MFEKQLQIGGTVAKLIDHTLLKPEATQSAIERLCAEASTSNFASVCVNPYWVPLAAKQLAASPVRVCAVVGFPLGAQPKASKLQEASLALSAGADEIDMVLNIGALKSGQVSVIVQELTDMAELVHSHGSSLRRPGILKVILETCLLSEEEKLMACRAAMDAGADFVKTSTGFSTAGATAEDVRMMCAAVGHRAQVKASGGIRTLAVLREMVDAGATRIGSSSGVSILQELQSLATNLTETSERDQTANPAPSSFSGIY